MKFAPEGHDYNGFTQYFFEGKELEFLKEAQATKQEKAGEKITVVHVVFT